ncbi:MAG: hypothetical protein EXR72_24580, partial [Myxococcales bacterium]|nr:hypothetical protein [Myxococcales bacterium]
MARKSGSRVEMQETVDERLIERAIAELREIVVGGQIGLMVHVGEYLVQHFFGDVAAARERRANKPASLRRLAERAEEFGMHPSGLMQSVAVAVQVRQFGKRIANALGTSHHIALLPVRDPEEKLLLAEAAGAEKWTVEELRRRIRRVQQPSPGGRPPVPRVRLLITRAARLLLDGEEA